jgi:hypothetical protein
VRSSFAEELYRWINSEEDTFRIVVDFFGSVSPQRKWQEKLDWEAYQAEENCQAYNLEGKMEILFS